MFADASPPHGVEAADDAVVHPEVAAKLERVAVLLCLVLDVL